jgi:DNA invertase Pin-like site-specific DNA recombinase
MNPRSARRFVAYYRVSTDRQGQSGLGLDAQRKAISDYLKGGAWELVGEFTEIESGKKSERPELARAMDACRKHKARLVIAKLDRLSRNLAFIATLMESGVEFVAANSLVTLICFEDNSRPGLDLSQEGEAGRPPHKRDSE